MGNPDWDDAIRVAVRSPKAAPSHDDHEIRPVALIGALSYMSSRSRRPDDLHSSATRRRSAARRTLAAATAFGLVLWMRA